MVRRLVPPEIRVERHREKQVIPVVDDDQLPAGTLERGMVNEVLLGAVGADVPFQRELARDNFFDRDFLVPAVAAVLFLATGFGDLLRAAECTPRLGDRLPGHTVYCKL